MKKNNICGLRVASYAMTKIELRRKRKALQGDVEREGSKHSMAGLDEESKSESGSASSGHWLGGRSSPRGGKI